MIAAIPLCLSHKRLAYIEIVGPIILSLTIIFGVLLENKDIVATEDIDESARMSTIFYFYVVCISTILFSGATYLPAMLFR